MRVEISNKKKYRISSRGLKKIFSTARKFFPELENQEISVALVDDGTIRKLNHQYRRINKVTDVLSFGSLGRADRLPPAVCLGEIIISYPQARRQARENKHSVQKELSFLLTHGCLHLLGFDHKTVEQRTVMEKHEARVLSCLAD